jgi:hypothetical protein
MSGGAELLLHSCRIKLLLAISTGHAIISTIKAALCRPVSLEVKVG